jgi:formyltetrahydrofolate-dependent phosphoribosylglycinamide formyltransferase
MADCFNIIVFISGTGSNLESLIKNQESYNYKISLVVSNNDKAAGLNIAKSHHIPIYTFSWDKADLELKSLQQKLNLFECDLIVLAGFMRILPEGFINKYTNKIINIHPSLLPKYPGLHTHQRALDNKDKHHGASVHFVTADLDAGKVVSQYQIKIKKQDDVSSLSSRLLTKEHKLYPYTIGLIQQNRVEWIQNQLYFDGNLLNQPVLLHD